MSEIIWKLAEVGSEKLEKQLVTREIAVRTYDKIELIYKDSKGIIHSLTSDETKIEAIKELVSLHREEVHINSSFYGGRALDR